MRADPRHAEHLRRWREKPGLRSIYEDYYRRIRAACRAGRTLEIGAGSGNMKAWDAGVVATDIRPAPWLDAVADAEALPFRDASFDNVVMLDVLHHVARPLRFLDEGARILRPGGRIVMIEPAITPLSWVFYKLFHPEPVEMRADPFADEPDGAGRDPFDANQGIPSLLFGRHRARLAARLPGLRILERRRLSLLCYPLSGGFRPWSLLPAGWVPTLLGLESRLLPVLGPIAAFRLLVVLERRAGGLNVRG